MALIDALLDKITDRSLRAALRKQVDMLQDKQQYGLVFQQHKPETVELYSHKVRRGCKVRIRSEHSEALYRVERVRQGKATVVPTSDQPVAFDADIDDLVVVREFGDAIYPGLASTGRVERGGSKPAHLVINAENFHALELLLYTHESKIDAIYIDPPYNTRDKDWKYNNDYVDGQDIYGHSKWLAMMQRRLVLADRLLNPADSVLIVTIDEREYLRLGLLLEQIFPDARITMVTSSINGAGSTRTGTFNRSAEYIYFVQMGKSAPLPIVLSEDWNPVGTKNKSDIRWNLLMRSGTQPFRSTHPNLFYPVFVRKTTAGPVFHSVGEPFYGDGWETQKAPKGAFAVWPIRKDGREGRWQISTKALRGLIANGHARLGEWRENTTTVYYLKAGEKKKVVDGIFAVTGHRADGSVITDGSDYEPRFVPTDIWRITSHDAGNSGSRLLDAFIPGRKFPFPKSLYAVEDALRFFVDDKPTATVLDFFAGSGTTMHAVARLNRQDGGTRRSICITNNEVSDDEAKELRERGFWPGDPAWEALGVCEYVTKRRVEAAITGTTHRGKPIAGNYNFVDEFPMADGLEENAEFFNLTYEDRDQIDRGSRFAELAPVLWLMAGGVGERIETPVDDWALPESSTYGVLFNDDRWREFADAVVARGNSVTHVFAVSESEGTFQQMLTEVPSHVVGIRLYSHYLDTFEKNTKGRS